MAIKLSQSLKQTQNLMMTPQLQQAIKLLTLTHLEMTNLIAEEMIENPMLEEYGVEEDSEKVSVSEDDYKIENLEGQNAEVSSESYDEAPVVAKDDFDWNSYLEVYNTSSSAPSMATPDLDEMPNYENIISSSKSLADHLEWQLRMEELGSDDLQIAQHIIGNINDDGYLEQSVDDLVVELNVSRQKIDYVLEIIQRLDPVGCGASDLTSCLLAQARIMEERSPLLEKIIRHHLQDLHQKDFEKIAKITGATVDAIKTTALLLQNFHPKPGRLIVSADTHYIIPDIYVIEVGGEFVVQMNDEGVPRLRISQLYQSMLKVSNQDKKAKEFVEDKLRSAMWLIKSIQNRQRTIVKVSKAIVAKQQEFFKKGIEYLKPMVLKDIANEIGMHESTVSRVTTSKYMHTPIGMFELKYFFNTGVGGKDGGSDVSSEVLRHKIKLLCDNENAKKPLSDQKIADLLSREGIVVARRTVAKYREALGIMPSSKRKMKG